MAAGKASHAQFDSPCWDLPAKIDDLRLAICSKRHRNRICCNTCIDGTRKAHSIDYVDILIACREAHCVDTKCKGKSR